MHNEHHLEGPGVEETDMHVGVALVLIGVALVTGALTFGLILIVTNALTVNRAPVEGGKRGFVGDVPVQPVSAPPVQASPRTDLDLHRQGELQALDSYGWVYEDEADRNTGIAHIPIDQAIEIAVEEGIPAFEPVE